MLRPTGLRPANIHRTTADAILGIPLNIPLRRGRSLPGLVTAGRAAACLQDLAERGWPTSFLAARLRTSTHTVAALRNRERRRLAVALDHKIQRLAVLLLDSEPADHGILLQRSRRAQVAATQRRARLAATIAAEPGRRL
ncbi:hypothetical protein [Streptomyces sp. NPDC048606]|uniref:hypothetical protein n=1 Tax=Streptomyces sp. NPDC048606 TaxID=3154726 RepID=UPI0034196E3C